MIDEKTELKHLRFVVENLRIEGMFPNEPPWFVVENLRQQVAEVTAERDRLRRADWVMFDLWSREVRPGWRMWRVRRRAEARESSLVPSSRLLELEQSLKEGS